MKNTRSIRSFEPEPDVDQLLDAAQENGLTIGEIVNKLLRQYGRKIISQLAKERSDKLRQLADLSFKKAGFQTPSQQEALAA